MSTIPLNNIQTSDDQQNKRPDWLKVQLPSGETFENVKDLMRSKTLHTVCEEARCPKYRRMLGARHRDILDDGRHLYSQLCVLRHQNWPSKPIGLARAAARGASRESNEFAPRRDHIR